MFTVIQFRHMLLSHPVFLSHPYVHCHSVRTHHPEMTLCGWQDMRIPILSNQITVQRHIHVKNVHVTYSLPLCLLREGFHCILVTCLQAIFFTCVWLACSKWHTTYLVVNVKWQVLCRRFSTVILFLCAILHNINYYRQCPVWYRLLFVVILCDI